MNVLNTDPVVPALAQGLDDMNPVLKAPKHRLRPSRLETDSGVIEGSQYFRFNRAGKQRLKVGNVTFNTATQVVGDYQ